MEIHEVNRSFTVEFRDNDAVFFIGTTLATLSTALNWPIEGVSASTVAQVALPPDSWDQFASQHISQQTASA